MRAGLCLLTGLLAAQDLVVNGPVPVLVETSASRGAIWHRIQAVVTVPADAPADLGAAGWLAERHGDWVRLPVLAKLAPGRQVLSFAVRDGWPTGDAGAWTAAECAEATRGGLVFWTTATRAVTLGIDDLRISVDTPPPAPRPRLVLRRQPSSATAGERVELVLVPEPMPADPYDPAQFACDATWIRPDGATWRIPAAYDRPHRAIDLGDRETTLPSAPGRFLLRLRPDIPGTWRLRLSATWAGLSGVQVDLPDLLVQGPARDEVVRIDGTDRRFFSVGGRFYWPVGINLRSVTDPRGADKTGSATTADRGLAAYEDYFARFAAGGVDTVEVWMSSWNLALEWSSAWPGFRGRGRYHQGNANRLDTLLDRAWAHGIRVVLVLHNHGQASTSTDREWPNHPWNRSQGGPLGRPSEWFSDPLARQGHAALRRYLVARYADHPALLTWKLWTEIDLTDPPRREGIAGKMLLANWHSEASQHLAAIDVYRHPISTHWSTDWRLVQSEIAVLPTIDLLAVDAYHQPVAKRGGEYLWKLLQQSGGGRSGLHGRYGKAVLVTEYGGSPMAAEPDLLWADARLGPWAAMVSGHAGSPMLWWFEWVDQGRRYQPYQAIRAFISGEDLRSLSSEQATRSVAFQANQDLWARGWLRRGRILGYVADIDWCSSGRDRRLESTSLTVLDHVDAGAMQLEWWNADQGVVVERRLIDHPGGALIITTPKFVNHLAFKLWRP